MDCYSDITLVPMANLNTTTALNATFAKLHLALVEYGNGEVGVSYPKFQKDLGDTIRIHGTLASLERVISHRSLATVKDYVRVSQFMAIPHDARHRVVSRVQPKSPARILRRSLRKGWVSEEDALRRLKEAKLRLLNLPFLELSSRSTRQRFRLFIQHGELRDTPQQGSFSTYGLSQSATIPWF